MMNKPFSPSCENNKAPIFQVLQPYLENVSTVLEIGSGTGQHLVYFAQKMPDIQWQPSDRCETLAGIHMWLQEAQLPNINQPIELDVLHSPLPQMTFDLVYSANCCHIMSAQAVEHMFSVIGCLLNRNGYVCLYGPFRVDGQFSSDSNAQFHQWLQQRDSNSGIKDIGMIQQLAQAQQLKPIAHYYLPANNEMWVWQRDDGNR